MQPSLARRQFATYVLIGGSVFVIDVGSFQGFLAIHIATLVAATLSYVLAIASHFTLNRYLNFRNFERSIAHQLMTYLTVAFFCWLVTLGVIFLATAIFHATPVVGKLIAVAVNVPIGFLAHRSFTFGPGLVAGMRKYINERAARSI